MLIPTPSQPVIEPKKQLQKVFENMTSPKKAEHPKPSIKDLQKETIPHHLKNTKQKMDALDDINALIQGVTDLSYLNQPKEQMETIVS